MSALVEGKQNPEEVDEAKPAATPAEPVILYLLLFFFYYYCIFYNKRR
jgi:hypothetical protein